MSTEEFSELTIAEQADLFADAGHFDGLSRVTLVLDRERPRQVHAHGVPVFIIPIEGLCVTLAGPDMEVYPHAPGSVMEIAAGVPHVGVNLDPDLPVVAHKISTSPDIKRDTYRMSEFDELVAKRTEEVRALYRRGELKPVSRTSGVVFVRQTVERFVDEDR